MELARLFNDKPAKAMTNKNEGVGRCVLNRLPNLSNSLVNWENAYSIFPYALNKFKQRICMLANARLGDVQGNIRIV
jgi:hypothetical protein